MRCCKPLVVATFAPPQNYLRLIIRFAVVGYGHIGRRHAALIQAHPEAELVAICDVERTVVGDEVPYFTELATLLSEVEFDVACICTPNGLHAPQATACLRADRHVLIEKPMALTTDQCEQMVAVAQDVGKQVFVAHVLPFFPEYAHARAVIAGGEYGQLIGGNFKRVISDPLWLEDFYDPQRVGGPLVDLHVHDAHLIRMLFGMPSAVTSTGRIRGEVVEYCDTLFHFDDDPSLVVRATGGVINQQGRPFTHGFEIHLERASLHYELGAFADEVEVMPLKILTDAGEVVRPELTAGGEIPAFTAEIEEVVCALQQNEPSEILSGELARDAIRLCYRQTESVKSNTRVKV